MLTVRSISNYVASENEEISVTAGRIFHVLSISSDGRKYFVATSSRLPFSTMSRSGFAPVVVFDVLNPDHHDGSLILGGNARSGARRADLPRRANSLTVAASRSSSSVQTRTNTIAAAAAASVPDVGAAEIAEVQIVTYARRRRSSGGVAFRTSVVTADGAREFTVHRSYDDFRRFDDLARILHPGLRAAVPFPTVADVDDEAPAALGKKLNVYLQTAVRAHRHLVARGRQGLPFEEILAGATLVPPPAPPPPATGAAAAAADDPAQLSQNVPMLRRDSGFGSSDEAAPPVRKSEDASSSAPTAVASGSTPHRLRDNAAGA